MRMLIIAGLAAALSAGFAHADDEALIAKVKTTWRAQDGETVEQILNKVAQVAHFIPRKWEVGQKNDAGEPVFLSWARHRTDKEDNERSITWHVAPDGSVTAPNDREMELGWQAYALSLIQSEIDDEEQGANRSFLHEVSNLNFVQTPQGRLGDLLKRGRCKLGDPVGVDYVPKVQGIEQGDFFRLQLSVDCSIPGPTYFTHDGIIIFVKHGTEPWQPQSFFAHRIAANPPGSWFDRTDPKEQEIFETARKVLERSALPVPSSPFPK
jgi:hypothetical protein